jgi:cytochrome c5
MNRTRLLLFGLALAVCSVVAGAEQPSAGPASGSKAVPTVQAAPSDDAMRLEGQQRFHANCGRCHQAPQKFPPRMMLTIERHMRVRALLTQEDMRLIVNYLTQ